MARSASPGERELRNNENDSRLYGSGPLVNTERQAARAVRGCSRWVFPWERRLTLERAFCRLPVAWLGPWVPLQPSRRLILLFPAVFPLVSDPDHQFGPRDKPGS